MKGLFKLISIFVLSFSFILNTFAIDATTDVKVNLIDDSSVEMTWNQVDWAYMYYVSYWKISREEAEYANVTDFIEWTWTTISWLETWNTYYFSVTSLDDSWNESWFSNEIAIDVNWWTNTSTFRLESIDVLGVNEIKLVFTNPLDSTEWTEREFNIYNKADKVDTIWVLEAKLDNVNTNELNLILDTDLQEGIEYEVVVIAIKNENWENIKSGIDSIDVFTYNGEIKEEPVEMNVALPVNAWPSWSDIAIENKDIVDSTTLSVAESPEKLPKTWPEHILIFILSIVLAWVLFVFKFKKA